ncbi:hypothetical protein M1N58_02420 [Dehalococcoidales bacterium]|nr:hypothetical protein [Dehalococcoidales bacterium]
MLLIGFPCFGIRGGIWLGLKPHCDIPGDYSLREAKLIKKKNSWFIHLTIEKSIDEPAINPDCFLRRHFAWLRGERKLLDVIKKIGHTERRKINAICHQISRQIVNQAKETGSTIVLGNLKGISKIH